MRVFPVEPGRSVNRTALPPSGGLKATSGSPLLGGVTGQFQRGVVVRLTCPGFQARRKFRHDGWIRGVEVARLAGVQLKVVQLAGAELRPHVESAQDELMPRRAN